MKHVPGEGRSTAVARRAMLGPTMAEGSLYEGALVADRYELTSSLGGGGFGEVWRAQDRRFGRAVAVKFMRAELARDATLRRRFAKEARALAAINHPNVVQVFDDGEWQGRPFVVLQLVVGSTLREWMEGYQKIRKLPPAEEVRALFAQVCDGVGAAHAKGIVHRDLKPENVLIEFDDEGRATAKVLDFGLARGGTLATSTGLQGGTIPYMSPEQATEGVEAAGPASDVFALGVMLVEMLTRRLLPEPPKQTTWWNAAQLGRAGAAVEDASRVRADVPAAVWAVIEKALIEGATERPATAGALRRVVDGAWGGREHSRVAPVAGANSSAEGTPPAVAPLPSVVALPSIFGEALAEAVVPVPLRPSIAPAEPGTGPDNATEFPAVKRTIPLWMKIAVGAGASSLLGLMVIHPWSGPRALPIRTPVRATISCPSGTVPVPEGEFTMGSPTDQGASDERPQHRVRSAAFCLDTTEVTVAAYRRCYDAGRCTEPNPYQSVRENGDAFCNWGRDGAAAHPINCVDWQQAHVYCTWAGARLPKEAEWEYAARGESPAEGAARVYPWGNAIPDGSRANLCGPECAEVVRLAGLDHRAGLADWTDAWGSTAPAGSFPAGNTPSGLQDMGGNVWEWVEDGYDAHAYVYRPRGFSAQQVGSSLMGSRVLRGGGWTVEERARVRAASRMELRPSARSIDVGFRCAWSTLQH